MNNIVTSGNSKALMSPEDLQVMKDSLFKGFTEPEIKFCVAIVNQLALSPLLRQIHFVKRFDSKLKRDVVVPQTGIDGFRLIAERTGKYAGSDEALYEYEGTNKKQPIKASVTVWKIVAGQRVAFTASARWDEFYPGDTMGFMWRSKPHVMLGKCAEAQALRKAFPAELSSVYSDEEMHVADAAEKKASSIQERILKPEQPAPIEVKAQEVTPEAEPVEAEPVEKPEPSFDLFNFPIPGDKFKGKVIGDLDPGQLRHYVDNVKKWFETEGKPVGQKWQEFFAKAEEYLGEVGE